jgi:acetyl esterase
MAKTHLTMIFARQQFSAIASLALAIPLGHLLHQPAPTEISYKHAQAGDLKLYCFQPDGATTGAGRPAALWIHGGGWTGGTCESFFPMARYTASRGAASFVVEYRLVKPGGPTVADAVADCKSAVRYLRRHAAELGIDPHRIAVLGESAGGHLAACVSTLGGCNDPADDLSVSARPDALVLYNPLTEFTQSNFLRLFTNGAATDENLKLARDLSPLFHVSAGQPPAICIHGLVDTVVPPEQSRRFAAAMKQAGNRCDLVLLPDTPHAFLIPNYKCSEAVVVNSLLIADKFLVSLGYFSGEPNLVVSDPPSWTPKWPPVKTNK